MDLMTNWVDIEAEMVSLCVICAVRTVKVWITFCRIAQLIRVLCIFFLFFKYDVPPTFFV